MANTKSKIPLWRFGFRLAGYVSTLGMFAAMAYANLGLFELELWTMAAIVPAVIAVFDFTWRSDARPC